MVKPVSTGVLLATFLVLLCAITFGVYDMSRMQYATYMCMDFDGKSSYKVRENQLRKSSQLVKGEGYINGILVTLYIPKSNLIGCVEIENAQ